MKFSGISFLLLVFTLVFKQANCQSVSSNDKIIIKSKILEWSNAHNTQSYSKLNELYSPNLLYYTKSLNKTECINKKSNSYKPGVIFNQLIISDITYLKYPNEVIETRFVKQIRKGLKLKKYPSYLLFYNYNGRYVIVGEGDEITDKKLKFKLDVNRLILPVNNNLPKGNSKSIPSLWLYGATSILVLGMVLLLYSKRKQKQVNEELTVSENPLEVNTNGVEQALKEKSIIKGREFEKYVVKKFDQNYFKFIDWRSDKFVDGRYPKSNGYPDLLYDFKLGSFEKKIAIECKFRQSYTNGSIELKAYQYNNYKKFAIETNTDVYLVIGVSGTPDQPQALFLVPLSMIGSHILHRNFLSQFSKSPLDNFFYKVELQKLT